MKGWKGLAPEVPTVRGVSELEQHQSQSDQLESVQHLGLQQDAPSTWIVSDVMCVLRDRLCS